MAAKGEERTPEGEQWGHSQEDLELLCQSCPCRHDQISSLLALFGEGYHTTPASIFVYGHTATGKTHVLTSLLSILKLPHVLVRCVECYSTGFLLEHILGSLPCASRQAGLQGTDADAAGTPPRCDNMNDFVRQLGQQLEQCGLEGETLYLVFEKAELLRGMDANLLPAFLRLQELTNRNICVILVSEIVWEKFRTGTGYAEPYQLLFPDYQQEELLQILMLDSPVGYDPGVYCHYLNILLAVFHLVCRDLRELRHLATLNFSHYIEPVEKGEATPDDHKKLWRHIEPHLKKALQTVYLREVSSLQWEKMQQQAAEGTGSITSLPSGRTHVELPFYSKYLLIAAYLASYNPAKTDRRFFVKNSGKVNKRLKMAKKHERTSNHLLGPKPFPLDRLMAIFYSLVEGRVAPTANIFSQVTSLVSLQLLAASSASDQIDAPRYKCLVSLDFIKTIARTVGFDIMRYLYDFI